MYYAIAAHLFTPNPSATASFLCQNLNFNAEHDAGGYRVDNGAVGLRLLAGEPNQASVLELQCSDIKVDAEQLLQLEGVHALTALQHEHDCQTQLLSCACGITLKLIKILDEDERGELIPLPTTLPWHEGTALQVQRILRISPLGFREQARKKLVQHAEYTAIASGLLSVDEAHAMQALVHITPEFQHEALLEAMLEEGLDALLYLDADSVGDESI